MFKKIILSGLLSMLAYGWVSAQDVMTLKSGEELTVKVLEVNDADIKYKKMDNPDGPSYTTKKADIFMIKYKNGSKEVFNAASSGSSASSSSNVSASSNAGPMTSINITDKTGIAKVKKINGIEAYFMCEPLRKYKVVFDVGGIKSNVQVKSLATGGIATDHVDAKANRYVKDAIAKANKDQHEIDAVLYTSAKSAVAIKFLDNVDENSQGLAKVQKIDDVEVYVFSEPLREYTDLTENKAKGKGGSFWTGGIVNSSIEEDITKLVKSAKGDASDKSHKLDAVIYSNGKTGMGVLFK